MINDKWLMISILNELNALMVINDKLLVINDKWLTICRLNRLNTLMVIPLYFTSNKLFPIGDKQAYLFMLWICKSYGIFFNSIFARLIIN